jgi:hypothetical protein
MEKKTNEMRKLDNRDKRSLSKIKKQKPTAD